MKKNFLLTVCILFISFISFAGKFVMIPVTESHNLEILFADNDLKIHYYCDNYVLATAKAVNYHNAVVLDENAFSDVSAYAIVYCHNNQKEEYLSTVSKNNMVLYSGDHFFVMKILSKDFMPAKNDGMIAVTNSEASLPRFAFDYPVITEVDETILGYISETVTDTLMAYIQTMENFVTRRCDHANSILAQNWIKSKYESYGLDVSIHTLNPVVHPWWGGTVQSGNVIAIQHGTEFPDEYIVCGGHFDSFAYQSSQGEPGADDDATGVAGIMETARILSQYQFKRSIIYCAFTAEECGLYGSGQFAQKCLNEGKNILGYFNLDMTGYLTPGSPIHFCLIYPNPALTLADYFVNVCDFYFPTVPITRHSNLSWGDSDHTSFNNKGYKGIWWFEDINEDSPFIHTPNDKIGPSVNNPEQVKIFTQASVASIAILAIPATPTLSPPINCTAKYTEDSDISITWNAPLGMTPVEYCVYKNNTKIAQTSDLSYIDIPENYGIYCYKITAVYIIEDEEKESGFSNESCLPLLPPPTNCLAKYAENNDIKITWEAPAINMPVEYYYVYKDDAKIAQTVACFYTDVVEDFDLHCYNATAFFKYNNEFIETEFSNESCDSVPFQGIIEHNYNVKIYPNPTTGELIISNEQFTINNVEVFDIYGKCHPSRVTRHASHVTLNISHLPAGVYFVKISTEEGIVVKEVIKQ